MQKLNEEELSEKFKKTLIENNINIDKFVDINTENLFEFFSSNTESLNKEEFMESMIPGDGIEFLIKNIF